MEFVPESDIENLLRHSSATEQEGAQQQLTKMFAKRPENKPVSDVNAAAFNLEDSDVDGGIGSQHEEDSLRERDVNTQKMPHVPASQIMLTGTEPAHMHAAVPERSLTAITDGHASPDDSDSAGQQPSKRRPSPVDEEDELAYFEEEEGDGEGREDVSGAGDDDAPNNSNKENEPPLDPLRDPTAGPFDARALEAQTQRILRDQAEKDRIGRGYVAEAKPFTDPLAKLKERQAAIALKLQPLRKAVHEGPADPAEVLRDAEARIAAHADALLAGLKGEGGEGADEFEIEEDEGAGDVPVVLVEEEGEEGEGEEEEGDSDEDFDPEGELAFDEDEELIQRDYEEGEDEDEKRRRRREAKRRKALGVEEGAVEAEEEGEEGEAEDEGHEEGEDAPVTAAEALAGDGMATEDDDEDYELVEEDATSSDEEEGEEEEGEGQEEVEEEGEGAEPAAPEAGEGAAPADDAPAAPPANALAALMHAAKEGGDKAAAVPAPAAGEGGGGLIEDEAEMSEDEGHTDDEEDGDEDGNLAELMGDHEERKKDEKYRIELHKAWEIEAEKKAMRTVLEGVRTGWKNVLGNRKRKGGPGDDEEGGTDLDARKRRAAQTFEAMAGFGEYKGGAGATNIGLADSDDEDAAGAAGDHTLHRMKERMYLDTLTSREAFKAAALDPTSQGIYSLITRAKDRSKEMVSGSAATTSAAPKSGKGGKDASVSLPNSQNTNRGGAGGFSLLMDMGESQGRSFLGRALAPSAHGVAGTTRTGVGVTTGRGFIFGGASMRGLGDDSQAGGAGDASNLGGGASGAADGAGLTLRAAFAGKLPASGSAPSTSRHTAGSHGTVPQSAGPGLVGLLQNTSQQGSLDLGRIMSKIAAPGSTTGSKAQAHQGFKRPFGR